MKKTLLFVFSVFAFSTSAQTLDECQQWAQDNYPLTRKYGLIDKTTEYTVSNIQKGWLPQISAAAQATYQSDVVTFPEAFRPMLAASGLDLKGLSKFQYRAGIDIQQNIYDGGNISNQKEIARLQGEVQSAQNDVDLYQLRDRINNLYFGALLLNERLHLNSEHLHLVTANRERLEALLSGGVAMQADVNALKAEEIAIRQNSIEMEATRESYLNVLSLFCGKKVTLSDDAAGQFASLTTHSASTSATRPEWALFDKQYELTYAQERQLRTALLPKISLFASGYYGYPGYDMYHDMFHRNPTLNGMVGLKVNWSISAFYTNKNSKLKLATQRELIQNSRDLFSFNTTVLSTQEEDAIERYRKLMAEDDQLIQLRQYVREASEAKLEGGVIDVNSLLQDITRENQARITKSSHEVEMQKHIYELKFIEGK